LRCNYDCMYCPTYLHDNSSPLPSLDELKWQWEQMFEKTKHKNMLYKINLSGGELTTNKNLLPFLQWLTDHYKQYIKTIGFISNGSASKEIYLRLFNYVNYISFSTHTEHIDTDKFFTNASACAYYAKNTEGKSFMVNIMEEFWAGEDIKKYITLCNELNIDYSISKIDYSVQTREIPIFKNKTNDI